jgi:CRP-like cAMP-binding protein
VGREDGPVRNLVAGEVLFRPGDPRTQLYIIESGMIALCCNRLDHPQDFIEFAFTANVVGLGFLDKHIYLAKTLSKSRLRSLPLGALDDLLQTNDRIRHRYDEAVRREFLARRGELIDTFRRKPGSRLASFFLALSQLNTHEGRDTNLIVDSLTCGIVSSCIALDVDSLAARWSNWKGNI